MQRTKEKYSNSVLFLANLTPSWRSIPWRTTPEICVSYGMSCCALYALHINQWAVIHLTLSAYAVSLILIQCEQSMSISEGRVAKKIQICQGICPAGLQHIHQLCGLDVLLPGRLRQLLHQGQSQKELLFGSRFLSYYLMIAVGFIWEWANRMDHRQLLRELLVLLGRPAGQLNQGPTLTFSIEVRHKMVMGVNLEWLLGQGCYRVCKGHERQWRT